jgi:hypothetical protein
VTLYFFNGQYYRNSVRDARPVVVYSRHNEYFMPPTDRAWVGSDQRYDYKHQPDRKDRRRAKDKDRENSDRGNGQP